MGLTRFGAGRLFVTCLSIYMLEVYYRHLPIYSGYRAIIPGSTEPYTASRADGQDGCGEWSRTER